MPNSPDDGLKTIQEVPETNSFIVPDTRMKDAEDVVQFVRKLIDDDNSRSYKRARVNGLIDGRPPYRDSKLKEAGRADACNVNWGIARSYLEAASGSFYDLFSEAPGYVTIRTAYGTPEQQDEWSNIISEEVDKVFRDSPVWDYEMSISIDNMVLHGCGPVMFEDATSPFPKAFLCGDLKVPEFTKSDTHYWDAGSVLATYYPPELYDFIEDEEAAAKIGWNVEYTKKVISRAMDIRQQSGVLYEWEFFQAELKNNTLSYYNNTKICRLAHVFWKEFDGRITHAITVRDYDAGLPPEYLFISRGRFDSWQNAIHPMYFDHGNGGWHHSVTGLGVKMYSAMEYENRLICNLADKAFSPKILFKPSTTEATQKFTLARFGDYGVLPKGADAIQNPIAGLMTDGLAMHQTISNLISSTLSAYRQQVPPDQRGNPPTKFQKQMEAAMQSALSKTQFNRYYAQLDGLYGEVYRRLSNINTTNDVAKEFQKRCEKRGVAKEAIVRTSLVQATRVVGQGSAFMRKQAIDSIFPIASALPENGRDNLIADKIAAEAGQSAVSRYFPRMKQVAATDQQAEAMQWVAAMKVGVPPILTPTQSAVVYAGTFLVAARNALDSLKQGGNPYDVLKFLNIAGPAIAMHLKRMANDPTREVAFKQLSDGWKQVAAETQQLNQKLQQMNGQMQQQQQKTTSAMTDEQIKSAKARSDIAIKTAKTAAQLKQSQDKHQLRMAQGIQDLKLKDARTAADIRINRMKSFEE